MNILFINTLRLGDTLMSWHIIKGIQQKYKSASIDYLTFDNSRPLLPILQGDVKFHFISRTLLQNMCADIDVSIFRAYDELERELKPVVQKKYDLIINYSNTKISTYLASMCNGSEIIGTHYNAQKVVNYGSKWIEYLDLKSTSKQGGHFHFNEIFTNALQVTAPENIKLNETTAGLVEVRKYTQSNKKKYVLQLFSNDKKKDFPIEKLDSFLTKLNQDLDGEFLLLCMPNSRELSIPLPIENAKWVPCSLEGAYSLIKSAQAVISVDTSIKHLAVFSDAKIIELCFGSSRPQQTGAYKSSALVIQSKEYCYPCRHSQACSREAIYCSQRLDVEEIGSLIVNYINNKKMDAIASVDYSTTYFDGKHYVLQSTDLTKVREYILTKLSWIYHLSDALSDEAHSLVHFFIEEVAGLSLERLNQNLIYLQRELEDVFRDLKVGKNLKTFTDNQRFINLQGILKNLNLDFQVPDYDGQIDFVQTRFLQNQLQDLLNYLGSYRRLSQDILSEAKYHERTSTNNTSI
ncbi:MAG: glycosyltransferase family 9 protein [Bdellovibrionales bacterium]|nr:glycosyltransferase family 9 protein [Bdellovibrionales bacterium]